ncbi:MAG: hypothetical protein MHM6MM_006974 [Cercozoa sp. M6MM]
MGACRPVPHGGCNECSALADAAATVADSLWRQVLSAHTFWSGLVCLVLCVFSCVSWHVCLGMCVLACVSCLFLCLGMWCVLYSMVAHSVESDDDALSVVTESTIDGEEPDLEFDLSRSEFWSSSVDVDDTAKRQRILQHKLSQALNNGVDLRACLRALQAGAQPSLPLRKVGDRALPSAWLWAATRSRMPVLRLLAQFDVSRSDLRDSLFMAAATGHYDVLDFLLTRFADEVRPDLAMALERAARYCQLESVERLCQEGPIASMKALIVCKSRRVKKVIRQYRSQYRRRLGRPSDEFVPRVPIRTHTYRILSQVQGQALPLDVVGEIVSFTFAKCDPEWV